MLHTVQLMLFLIINGSSWENKTIVILRSKIINIKEETKNNDGQLLNSLQKQITYSMPFYANALMYILGVNIQREIYELQTSYLTNTKYYGNILKGFQDYSTQKMLIVHPQTQKGVITQRQRLFSFSSYSIFPKPNYSEGQILGQQTNFAQKGQFKKKEQRMPKKMFYKSIENEDSEIISFQKFENSQLIQQRRQQKNRRTRGSFGQINQRY